MNFTIYTRNTDGTFTRYSNFKTMKNAQNRIDEMRMNWSKAGINEVKVVNRANGNTNFFSWMRHPNW